MSKLARFFATCLLVVSLSTVALAADGQTQGSGFTSPPPSEISMGSPKNIPSMPDQATSVDSANEMTLFITMLLFELIF